MGLGCSDRRKQVKPNKRSIYLPNPYKQREYCPINPCVDVVHANVAQTRWNAVCCVNNVFNQCVLIRCGPMRTWRSTMSRSVTAVRRQAACSQCCRRWFSFGFFDVITLTFSFYALEFRPSHFHLGPHRDPEPFKMCFMCCCS